MHGDDTPGISRARFRRQSIEDGQFRLAHCGPSPLFPASGVPTGGVLRASLNVKINPSTSAFRMIHPLRSAFFALTVVGLACLDCRVWRRQQLSQSGQPASTAPAASQPRPWVTDKNAYPVLSIRTRRGSVGAR